MIYTVTFNPALDYIMHMGSMTTGITNRSSSEEFYYGGKGINVSIVLSHLGLESTALGFIAGFTGDEIEKNVKGFGVSTDFIKLPAGNSRINIKIKSDSNGETEINAQGPEIDDMSNKALFTKLNNLKDGDVIILAGSIPSSLPNNVYENILSLLDGRNVLSVVDATGDLLKNVLKYKPFLVKPNKQELGEIFGKELETEEEILHYAKELQKLGARNVLISMAGDGSLLVDENGAKTKLGVCSGKVINSVGAGDSMVAGFVAGYLKEKDYSYALKLGTACGGATAFSKGLAEKDTIDSLLTQLM